jgi:hypothetical protein
MLAEVVDRENVRVIESARGSRFLLETSEAIRFGGDGGRKDLYRNVTMKGLVMRAVHHTHPTGADLLDDAIVGKRSADQGIQPTPLW